MIKRMPYYTANSADNILVEKINELVDGLNDMQRGIFAMLDLLKDAGLIRIRSGQEESHAVIRKDILGESE